MLKGIVLASEVHAREVTQTVYHADPAKGVGRMPKGMSK